MNQFRNRNEAYDDIEWQDIDWKAVRRYTRRLENSIAKAVEYHDFKQVNVYTNLQLLHGHCHDTKTLEDVKKTNKAILNIGEWNTVK
ncbi:MAG: hypothetical protein DRR16_01280 [Candidatus Parabeggiatoa sp. nov. 3]|nr:MAG: hypothetical protein DRR00_01970 [Gammaproteobacteria bacterium]RKZ69679.1 MAG: hypothetical protein DRQ99_00355 [Gammaproteobacteria bacterium]RKZ89891.1 MAG: hypothetical protein DRR16_01280 [Gammaproteobacteria bacterium]